jgi:prepilin peptidase CpaA
MTALVGGIIGVIWAVAGGFLIQALRGAVALIFRRRKEMTLDNPAAHTMPYAPAIALGTICSFLTRSI